MSLALESVRETLGMRLIDDPAKRLVAQKIIELRQRGLRGDTLQVMTLEALKQKADSESRSQILRARSAPGLWHDSQCSVQQPPGPTKPGLPAQRRRPKHRFIS